MTNVVRRLLIVVALVPAACGGQAAVPVPYTAQPTSTPAAASPSVTTPSAAVSPSASPVAGADAAGIVWVCMPGAADNPCTADLSVTVIDPAGNRTTADLVPAADPPIDCFYVYPTTSRQTTMNADLSIHPEERVIAAAQAALFSQVCRVYAPVYPQLTLAALNSGGITAADVQAAYDGVYAAFVDYLASYNHGRGVVLIGHSQGAMLLDDLLHFEIDPKPDLRRLLVSALLMGGNVMVAEGQTIGGDLASIPACGSASQVGCVVGYSSFAETPPPDASFGRVDGALSMLPIPKSGPLEILCVNPAAPGGTGTLLPFFPTADALKLAGGPMPAPTTAFVSYPDALTASCRTSGGARWLQVTRTASARSMPTLSGSEGPGGASTTWT